MSDAGSEINSGGSYTGGNWYGVAIVIDATNGIRLYATTAGGDASTFSLVGTSAWSSGAVTPNTGSGTGAVRLGCDNDTTMSNIYIQSPQIYFEALSLAQLQALAA